MPDISKEGAKKEEKVVIPERCRLANQEELNIFESVVGSRTIQYLAEIGSPLFIDEDMPHQLRSKTDLSEKSLMEELGLVPKNYQQSDFSVIIDGRFVMMSVFKKIRGKSNKRFPEKVLQIDFVLIEDWESPSMSMRNSYERRNVDAGGKTLFTEAAKFLRKMQKLAQSVDQSCIIQIATNDSQRKKIYEIGLKGLSNVRYYE